MITLMWVAVFIVTAAFGGFGFVLNASTPEGVGPLPFICVVIAAVAFVIVIARLAV